MKEKINRDNVENNYPDEDANQLDVEFRGLEREKLFFFSMNEKYIIYDNIAYIEDHTNMIPLYVLLMILI